jgi:restriction system protein
MKRKWIAFFLCLFLGMFGAHKFYEGKIGMGILYFFTAGLFGFGWIADCIAILRKPDPYYV